MLEENFSLWLCIFMKVEQTSNLQSHRHPSLLFNGLLMRIWRGLGTVIDSASDPKDLAKINSAAELANSLQLAPAKSSVSVAAALDRIGIGIANCDLAGIAA